MWSIKSYLTFFQSSILVVVIVVVVVVVLFVVYSKSKVEICFILQDVPWELLKSK